MAKSARELEVVVKGFRSIDRRRRTRFIPQQWVNLRRTDELRAFLGLLSSQGRKGGSQESLGKGVQENQS